MTTLRWRPLLLALSALAIGTASTAQAEPVPEWMKSMAQDPADPRTKPQRDLRKKQVALEKELRKLRAKHFRSAYQPARDEGIRKLRTYDQPWMIQPIVEVFQDEHSADLQETLISILRASKSDQGDRGLAWLAVSADSKTIQTGAIGALSERLIDQKQVPTEGMLAVLQTAVLTKEQAMADSAANAIAGLKLYELIPFLVQGQTAAPPATTPLGRPRNGPLAWIAIAQQQAYTADLTPMVADNAVIFDPTPGVVNSGVVLVINDAAVTFSPAIINTALVGLSERIAGQPTNNLGLNPGNWAKWYQEVGEAAIAKAVEHRLQEAAELEKSRQQPSADAAASQQAAPTVTPTTPPTPESAAR